MRNQLLEYQESAVKTLSRRIMTRGGAMLGDVVGLGKTITATATAMMLNEAEGYRTLIVCPPNLEKMWWEYKEKYELNATVVPYSMAAKRLPDLGRYQFVIVDESHTMRSDSRQDYKALLEYIRNYNSKVLLLTATPYNIRFRDVANQLGLYLEPDEDLGLQHRRLVHPICTGLGFRPAWARPGGHSFRTVPARRAPRRSSVSPCVRLAESQY
ncbi:SNF2 family N-terminal domain [Promicromonospora umidemergens]|uniref:Helicase ATP-binding domain-containing protein n=2 Tax=Micrococcales TaxID=85006 RepID=A0ABP8YII0_9MICO|nr:MULTISPECIES: SNF2-related protein [Micrococcales]MBB5748929.1 superfamily II DNA or RNA helicase [Micrococcus sp. TA1]MCI2267216.1 hypothetical protein [Sediminivirga luteola]MCP2286957.1 SNF2 family N-terminal domain [Promicromonospora umidemergens]